MPTARALCWISSRAFLLGVLVGLANNSPVGACLAAQSAGAAEEEPDPEPRIVLPDESMYSPSPQDGGGTARVEPKTVSAGQPCTLTFTYTAGDKGVLPGGGVLCYVSRFWYWAAPQTVSPQHRGYSTVTCSNPEVELGAEVDPHSQTIWARVEGKTLKAGEKLPFTYGDTTGGQFPQAQGYADRFAERGERFYFKVDGDGDGWFAPIEKQPRFDVLAGDAARFVVFGPSRVPVGESFELRVSALDASNNLAGNFTGEGLLLFDEQTVEAPKKAVFKDSDRGSIGVRVTAKRAGLMQLAVRVPDEDSTPMAASKLILVHEPGPQKYQLCWADLQIHGNLSDGTGTPTDIYRYARDVARLDAAALTEHDRWGYIPLAEDEQAWQRILRVADRTTEDGRFVTFPAYEWTNSTYGHQHVLFARRQDAVVRAWNDPKTDHPEELWKALRGVDCVTIPHHTGGAPIPTCWKYSLR